MQDRYLQLIGAKQRADHKVTMPHACTEAHLLHGVDAHARAVDLDLVGVHGGVGDQDGRVLDALGLPHADALVQDEALVQERLLPQANNDQLITWSAGVFGICCVHSKVWRTHGRIHKMGGVIMQVTILKIIGPKTSRTSARRLPQLQSCERRMLRAIACRDLRQGSLVCRHAAAGMEQGLAGDACAQ